jgi:hypothetical protein
MRCARSVKWLPFVKRLRRAAAQALRADFSALARLRAECGALAGSEAVRRAEVALAAAGALEGARDLRVLEAGVIEYCAAVEAPHPAVASAQVPLPARGRLRVQLFVRMVCGRAGLVCTRGCAVRAPGPRARGAGRSARGAGAAARRGATGGAARVPAPAGGPFPPPPSSPY